jgi:uncharacterized membrane protein YkvA (DUF1232 family)
MAITIEFELSDKDIEHFVAMAQEAHDAVVGDPEAAEKIAGAAREVFEKARDTELPDFIAERLTKLGTLADMVTDAEWQLPEDELERVLSAMAYFSNPEDLIPDRVPGIGFLDDAIMAELVVNNLDAEISAYQEFCTFRTTEEQRRVNQGLDPNVSREDWLADKRAVLHHRMRERRKARVSGTGGWRVSLW